MAQIDPCTLINQLELESPRAIGLDIIFSESDINNPLSDVLTGTRHACQRQSRVAGVHDKAEQQLVSHRSPALTRVQRPILRLH